MPKMTSREMVDLSREYTFFSWAVQSQVNPIPVEKAEGVHFWDADGKRYLDSLEVLRCKIMGYWYCARFEGILDIIERDGYTLRAEYKNQFVWLKMLWLGVILTIQHIFSQAYYSRGKNTGN